MSSCSKESGGAGGIWSIAAGAGEQLQYPAGRRESDGVVGQASGMSGAGGGGRVG